VNKQLEDKLHEVTLENIQLSNKVNKFRHEVKDLQNQNRILEVEVSDLQNAKFEKQLLHDKSKDDAEGLKQKLHERERKEKETCNLLDKLMNK